MTFLASFLVVLGTIQLLSVYFGLRGLSLTGPLNYPGMLAGVFLITAGVWLAIDEPWWPLLLYAVPSVVLAVLALSIVGIIVNLPWNPTRRLLTPQFDDGWSVEQVHIPVTLTHVFQASQGALHDMPATFLRPKSTQADKPVTTRGAVLVICGAGDCRTSFKWRLFNELLGQGIAVLTIDPPGHGDFFDVPMTVANARAAGKAALEWLRAQPGIARVGVCGISFGGCQAASLAADTPAVDAVALVSTPVHLDTLTRWTYAAEVLSLFIWPRNWTLLREGSFLTMWREWRSLRGARYGQSLYEMIDRFDACGAVRGLGSRPKLIVHGSRDVAIPLRNARALYDAAAPQRELMVVRQATHLTPALYPREMRYLAGWFARWLNYNRLDAQQAVRQ